MSDQPEVQPLLVAAANKQAADEYIQRTFRSLFAVVSACDDADVCPLCQEDIGSGVAHRTDCPMPAALKTMEVGHE